jgi:hypothetical protein
MMRETDFYNPLDWDDHLFFEGMNNGDLARLTESQFLDNQKSYGTHPVFLLRKIERGCYEFCPCSSKEYNRDKASFIRKDAKTSPRGLRVERNSYILHFYPFRLSASDPLIDRMPLIGKIDETDIVGNFHFRPKTPSQNVRTVQQ